MFKSEAFIPLCVDFMTNFTALPKFEKNVLPTERKRKSGKMESSV